jgi:hypothetical protein
VWKALSEERRLAAATAFWTDEQAVAEQAEAIGLIARQINFRPRSILALPVERKARLLARSGQVSDSVASRLLVAYHLAHQRPLLTAFLDSVGIAHHDGLLSEDAKVPDRDTLVRGARQLFENHPEEDVKLYFTTLIVQDAETWAPLQDVLQERTAAHQ